MAVLGTVVGVFGRIRLCSRSLACLPSGRPHERTRSYAARAGSRTHDRTSRLFHKFPHPNLLPEGEGANGFTAVTDGKVLAKPHADPASLILLVTAVFMVTACVIPLQQGKQGSDPTPKSSERNTVKERTTGLIRASIPDKQGPGSDTRNPSAFKPGPVSRSPIPKDRDRPLQWEDEKVKTAARALAKSYPSVKKIQVCYDVKDDEWWVILYDDIGKAFDLKRFIWNRESGEMEPFLVPRQIPKKQLKSHLAKEEPGRACEILEPWKGP